MTQPSIQGGKPEVTKKPAAAQASPESNPAAEESVGVFGVWVYLMTDCVLFAALFAVFAVLRNSTNGAPAGRELFSLPFVLTETLLLLTSSLTCGLAMFALGKKEKKQLLGWLFATLLLGAGFLLMEMTEFRHLVHEGHGWRVSAFLSSFFTLVGTHGLHIAVGLFWILVLLLGIAKRGITDKLTRRVTMFGLFWHFLDIIWVFIFTIVYLIGSIKP